MIADIEHLFITVGHLHVFFLGEEIWFRFRGVSQLGLRGSVLAGGSSGREAALVAPALLPCPWPPPSIPGLPALGGGNWCGLESPPLSCRPRHGWQFSVWGATCSWLSPSLSAWVVSSCAPELMHTQKCWDHGRASSFRKCLCGLGPELPSLRYDWRRWWQRGHFCSLCDHPDSGPHSLILDLPVL